MTEQGLDKEFENADTDERDLWPSPGQKIRKLREGLGYSREKVSETLFITVHYVTALENDDFQKLPGPTFTKGYFRSYAEFLGADVDEVLTCYQNFVSAEKPSSEETNRQKRNNRNKSLFLWMLAGVVLLAVLIALVVGMTSEASAKQITAKQQPNLELWQETNS